MSLLSKLYWWVTLCYINTVGIQYCTCDSVNLYRSRIANEYTGLYFSFSTAFSILAMSVFAICRSLLSDLSAYGWQWQPQDLQLLRSWHVRPDCREWSAKGRLYLSGAQPRCSDSVQRKSLQKSLLEWRSVQSIDTLLTRRCNTN